MSSKGQDTMFFYYVNKFSLFELEFAIGKQKPIPEIKDIFQEFFRNKLDEGDLHILNEHWDQWKLVSLSWKNTHHAGITH